jgi:[ribosomal protein S5]-alanine N-acetyltransferase
MSEERSYEIRVKGVLGTRWSALFEPLVLVPLQEETLLTGPVQDQPELLCILLKIRDLGLVLVSVNPASKPKNTAPFPELTTERLLLREFTPGDAPAVFEILHRQEVNEWLETDPLQTIEQAEARIRDRIGLYKDGLGCRWAITARGNPAHVIGSCGYFSVRRKTHTVEAGYELHPGYWHKGIMTEALRAMIQYSFRTQNPMPVHRIEALVAPGNCASVRILELLGFECERLRREFFFWKNCYQDVFLYALLNNSLPQVSN